MHIISVSVYELTMEVVVMRHWLSMVSYFLDYVVIQLNCTDESSIMFYTWDAEFELHELH